MSFLSVNSSYSDDRDEVRPNSYLHYLRITVFTLVKHRKLQYNKFIQRINQRDAKKRVPYSSLGVDHFEQVEINLPNIMLKTLNEDDIYTLYNLEASNGKHFTKGELLYKIAQILPTKWFFRCTDHIFWEGIHVNKHGVFNVIFGS